MTSMTGQERSNGQAVARLFLRPSFIIHERDLQKRWHGHLARDSWPGFAMRTAIFHGQDARATTSARGS